MLTNDPELDLLGGEPSNEFDTADEAEQVLKTAPIITGDAFDAVGSAVFPQRALYGRILEASTGPQTKSPKLYINTNAPFSGIVCGVQGSGKSHSTSVLLESCLICDRRLGTLPEPLSAILFHFDTAAGAGELPPCEAACIASLEPRLRGDAAPPKVVVLVLPNNLENMRGVYSTLPDVRVEPLHFAPEDLSGDRMLAMMKVEQDSHMPLYMECIMSLLRGMSTFSYEKFRSQLKEQKFSVTQKTMLDIRLNILDSCLEGGNASNRVSTHFEKGQLTIIDLSSPFMDASSACGFFDIILGLFIQAKTTAFGKLVVLDEAHKYLTNSGSSSRLTDSLLSVIRQQRHLGTRVLISTQEPTVVPSKFLDLCSFVIAHRFSSQKWLDHLKEHISAVDTKWGSKVINLKTGEAMIFSPAALVMRQIPHGQDASSEAAHMEGVAMLGQGYLKVRSRKRITVDGGRSVMATGTSIHEQNTSISEEGWSNFSPKSIAVSVQSPGKGLHIGDWKERPSIIEVPYTSIENKHSLPPSSGSPGVGWSSMPETAPATSTNAATAALTQEKNFTGSSNSSGPVPNIGPKTGASSQPPSTSSPEIRFRPLISTLEAKAKQGQPRMFFSDVGVEIKKTQQNPYAKLGVYLREAEQANIVRIGGSGTLSWVELVLSGTQSYPHEYVPLVSVMRALLDKGKRQPTRDEVATRLYKIPDAVPGRKFKTYILGAEEKGVVVSVNQDRLRLATSIR